jgi:hypothetical protein
MVVKRLYSSLTIIKPHLRNGQHVAKRSSIAKRLADEKKDFDYWASLIQIKAVLHP